MSQEVKPFRIQIIPITKMAISGCCSATSCDVKTTESSVEASCGGCSYSSVSKNQ